MLAAVPGAALLLDVCGRGLEFEFRQWLVVVWRGAVCLDLVRLPTDPPRRRATSRRATAAEQAIASHGGPRFAASMLIVGLMGLALVLRPWFARHQVEPGVPVGQLMAVVGVIAALWNFWHVYMQKYGIMRLYNAKARAPGGPAEPRAEVPGWIDRALVLCWLPLYFAYLGPLYREIAVDYFDDAAAVLPGFIDVLEQAMPVTLAGDDRLRDRRSRDLAAGRADGQPAAQRPRLAMAFGTTGLALCFFVFDPVKVYLAFAFSHALEYCVFVWAFQRKRYQAPLAHDPPLGRLLRHPLVFYVGMILAFGVAILLLKYWGRWIFARRRSDPAVRLPSGLLAGVLGHLPVDGPLLLRRLPVEDAAAQRPREHLRCLACSTRRRSPGSPRSGRRPGSYQP